jgi:hypothetical protein
MRSAAMLGLTDGRVKRTRTSIPFEIETVSVGTMTEKAEEYDRKKVNDKGALPHRDKRYKIKCRLRIDRYTRPEAYARCEEINGTTFDGMFMSGSFYVFWSNV